MCPARPSVAVLSACLAVVLGASEHAAARETLPQDREQTAALRRAMPGVQRCYRRTLALRPGIAGRMTLALEIHGDGSVATAHIDADSIGDPQLTACVTRVFEALQFGPQTAARSLRLPLVLAP